MTAPRPRPIVIVGLPRSGTTWTLRALASASGTTALLEPDNEDKYPASIQAKHAVGRYPVLRPGDQSPPYRDLWTWIMTGAPEGRRSRLARYLLSPGAIRRIYEGRRDPVTWLAGQVARSPRPGGERDHGRIVAKSIHAQLATEWLAAEFDVGMVLLLRHPGNVLASWLEMNLKDARNSTLETRPEIRSRYLEPWGVPLPGPDPVERMSWRIGLLTAAVEDAASRHPEWHLRTHERLCSDPTAEFRQLYADLGLDWGESSESFLEGHNAPGSGFVINRVASELSDSWRHRLDDEQLATLRRVLELFPISTWTGSDFTRSRTD
jgi:Sulfotransferase family